MCPDAALFDQAVHQKSSPAKKGGQGKLVSMFAWRLPPRRVSWPGDSHLAMGCAVRESFGAKPSTLALFLLLFFPFLTFPIFSCLSYSYRASVSNFYPQICWAREAPVGGLHIHGRSSSFKSLLYVYVCLTQVPHISSAEVRTGG
ncbi:hypothetical protein LY78DRAFT_373866 [Colletotrichum sublineola]|nr:hypothetical protein LY78DRAFT_373866 [Colletotrichum sublineola]